jgi:hypothetical protein
MHGGLHCVGCAWDSFSLTRDSWCFLQVYLLSLLAYDISCRCIYLHVTSWIKCLNQLQLLQMWPKTNLYILNLGLGRRIINNHRRHNNHSFYCFHSTCTSRHRVYVFNQFRFHPHIKSSIAVMVNSGTYIHVITCQVIIHVWKHVTLTCLAMLCDNPCVKTCHVNVFGNVMWYSTCECFVTCLDICYVIIYVR